MIHVVMYIRTRHGRGGKTRLYINKLATLDMPDGGITVIIIIIAVYFEFCIVILLIENLEKPFWVWH